MWQLVTCMRFVIENAVEDEFPFCLEIERTRAKTPLILSMHFFVKNSSGWGNRAIARNFRANPLPEIFKNMFSC